MSDNKTGIEKARETADKLKAETEVKEEMAVEAKAAVENQLATIKANPELARMYSDNAQVGADNLGGVSPLLKVHQVGKSSTNELADGGQPNDGYFFYRPTGEQFETLIAHVLTISRGFRSQGLNQDLVFNQIMGGVIVDGTEYKPFLMYFTGKKLAPMWDFAKEAAKYTRSKTMPIPMFALTVKMSTHSEKNSKGVSHLVDFEILKDEEGFPKLITDPGEFQFLKDSVDTIESTIEAIVAKKANLEEEEIRPVTEIPGNSESVDSDSIPF